MEGEGKKKKKKKNEKQKNLKYNPTKDCSLASKQQVIRLAALIIDGVFFSMEFVSKTIIPFNKRLKRGLEDPVSSQSQTVNYKSISLVEGILQSTHHGYVTGRLTFRNLDHKLFSLSIQSRLQCCTMRPGMFSDVHL